MDKNYIIFIIGYKWCRSMESPLALTCDEAFDLAGLLADKYLVHCKSKNITPDGESLYDYINQEIDFEELCKEMQKLIELQITEYENDNCKMHYFKVSKEWLEKYLAEQFLGDPDCDMMYSSIEDFMGMYTSEESREVYAQAVLESEIREEHYSE